MGKQSTWSETLHVVHHIVPLSLFFPFIRPVVLARQAMPISHCLLDLFLFCSFLGFVGSTTIKSVKSIGCSLSNCSSSAFINCCHWGAVLGGFAAAASFCCSHPLLPFPRKTTPARAFTREPWAVVDSPPVWAVQLGTS